MTWLEASELGVGVDAVLRLSIGCSATQRGRVSEATTCTKSIQRPASRRTLSVTRHRMLEEYCYFEIQG
ncbi:hypothetical protein M6B38_335585 [Iris pallida]|uniref:Uncharacterized protein n=1 Tax=Iris pallida TaxID=29817 RepID=A0AAX6H0L9_IRIPA|nr:hypothetical protein M6B38_335585 [Iris pallida]